MRAASVAWVMGLAMLVACSSTGEPAIDSSTHWLSACVDDDDCGALSCICGVCSEVCDSDAVCGELVDGAVCAGATAWETCEVASSGVCSDACSDAADCPTGAPSCVDGACVAVATGPGDDVGEDAAPDDVGADTAPDDAGADATPGDAGAELDAAADVTDAAVDAGGPCTEAECDPAPGAPSFLCPDGSLAGPVCERNDAGVCGWIFTQCQSVTGCYGDDGCEGGQVCNAGSICLQDPTCPECDVCYGWCTSADDPCDREACGAADTGDGDWRLCDDGSLAGPVCFERGEACEWAQTYCAEDELP